MALKNIATFSKALSFNFLILLSFPPALSLPFPVLSQKVLCVYPCSSVMSESFILSPKGSENLPQSTSNGRQEMCAKLSKWLMSKCLITKTLAVWGTGKDLTIETMAS